MFWVISVWFDLRNTLPKLGPFLLGHPVYIYMCVYVCVFVCESVISELHSFEGQSNIPVHLQ